MRPNAVILIGCAAAMLATAQVGVAEYNPARTRPAAEAESTVQRVIVRLRTSSDQPPLQTQTSPDGESGGATAAATAGRVRALASRAQVTLESAHGIGPNLQVMHVSPVMRGETADLLARLQADSDVEYAVLDRRVYPHAASNDPLAAGQWYLQATEPSAINAIGAWDITTGSNGVVTAVIDTGVRFDHPDLKRASQSGRLLPGYDFVSADPGGGFTTANDSDGRDPDPSDPGDWVVSADNCGSASDSSWHGTRVSGIIGALTNNTLGVAGITWSGLILPVRVLGKCGGFNSDVLAGMRWAAGLHVDGVPDNTTPARILNVSLGGAGACDSASADVISEVASNGVLVVASAGNKGGPVGSPANCPGAMGITGLRHAGTKVGFSSLGPEIALGAPGGNCVNPSNVPCLFSIDTTSNDGTTTPGNSTYTDQTNYNVGTSFSAPIVSGIAGLMLAVNGHLQSSQLIARLKEGATKPFPVSSDTTIPTCHVPTSSADLQPAECNCTTSTCGAGMANALGSVNAALRPIAAIAVQGSVTPGNDVSLQGDGSAAADNHSISMYSWTMADSTISNAATATVPAPTSGTVSVCLTVTDDAGKQDTARIIIGPTSTTTPTPVNVGAKACPPEAIVSATDTSAAETGPEPGTFTFTRTGDVTSSLSVTIAVTGTATNSTDYQNIGTNVTFAAGQATTTGTVTPIDDSVVEGTESVTVTLQQGDNYDLGTQTAATVTIADNDTAAPPPSSGGGGGGAMDWITLLASLAAVTLAITRTACGSPPATTRPAARTHPFARPRAGRRPPRGSSPPFRRASAGRPRCPCRLSSTRHPHCRHPRSGSGLSSSRQPRPPPSRWTRKVCCPWIPESWS
jgi:serine protease